MAGPDSTFDPNATVTPPPAAPPADAMPAAQLPHAIAPPAGQQAPAPEVTRDPNVPTRLPQDTFGARIYHGVLGALGGANESTITGYNPTTGKPIISTRSSNPADQWKNIIAGALTGYAKGMGESGPGAMGRAGAKGFEAGEQRQQDMRDQAQKQGQQNYENELKAATAQANNSLLATQIARNRFTLSEDMNKASQDQIDRFNTYEEMIGPDKPGSRDIGIAHNFQEAMAMFKNEQQLHHELAQGHMFVTDNVENGKTNGIRVAVVSPDWENSNTDHDISIPYKQTGPDGKIQHKTFTIPAGQIKNGKVATLLMAQSKEASDEDIKQLQADIKEQAAKTAGLREQVYASDVAGKNRERTTQEDWNEFKAKGGGSIKGANPGETPDGLVDGIGRGQIEIGRMGYLLARNPALVDEVMRRYPDFDSTKVDKYVQAQKEFSSSKQGTAGYQMTAASAALKHLYRLQQLNTKTSLIPGTNDHQKYETQLTVLADELAKFYGTNTETARKKLEDNLDSFRPSNRKAGMDTQVQALGDRLDTLSQQYQQAAPSAVYEAKMPQIDDNAKAARAFFDPEYKKTFQAEIAARQQQQPQQNAPAAPQMPTRAQAPPGAQFWDSKNNQWLDAQQKPIVTQK